MDAVNKATARVDIRIAIANLIRSFGYGVMPPAITRFVKVIGVLGDELVNKTVTDVLAPGANEATGIET